MGSPAIFNGPFVKLLKDQIRFKDSFSFLTGTDDPTVTSQDANPSSLYFKQDTGELFIKKDSGPSTNWIPFDKVDTSNLTETLKNQFLLSPYEALTPNVFAIDKNDNISGTSTGSYNAATNQFEFSSSGQTLVSTQQLDSNDFLNEERDVGNIDISVFWTDGYVDSSATYEVSRDGGNEWQTISVDQIGSTSAFYGTHSFQEEASFSTLDTIGSSNTNSIDFTDNNKLAQKITLAESSVFKEFDVTFGVSNAPVGKAYASIVLDDGYGLPSTELEDLVAESAPIDISTLTDGYVETISMPSVVKTAGDYHIVIRTDDQYKTEYTNSSGSNKISLAEDFSASGGSQFSGSSWSDTTNGFLSELRGRELDLRLRITSSTSDVSLDGFGIFYDQQVVGVSDGLQLREVNKFKAVADNFNEFTLTNFLPDPDLLEVFHVEEGKVYKFGAFILQGHKVVFPSDFFNNGGMETDVTLIFEQLKGSSFDNSDQNASLLANNFLGSTDSDIDKSSPGRGIFLRRPDGTLREITIDNNDNIVIYSV